MPENVLSGGQVSLPIKPDVAGFGGLLKTGIKGELGGLGPVLEGFGGNLGKNLLVGFGAVAAAGFVVDLVKSSVEAQAQAQLSTTKLTTIITDSGHSYSTYADNIEAADTKMRGFGFTNAETKDALGVLTTALQDPSKALSVLGVSADLARAKNMDLSSAALMVAKGMEGQIRPLKALGIDLPVYAGTSQQVALAQKKLEDAQGKVNDILAATPNAVDAASKAHGKYEAAMDAVSKAQALLNEKQSSGGQILQTLSDRLKGSAADASETYTGKQKKLQAEWDNVKEKAGGTLMPVFSTIVDWINSTGLPGMDLFIQGWDGVGITLSNTAAAGQFVHDVLSGLVDFIQGSAKEIADLVGLFSGDNAIANAGAAENIRQTVALHQAQHDHPGVIPGQPGGFNGLRNSPTSNAQGGTYQPRPGGHIIQVAEAGRSETIVDTKSLNDAVKNRPTGGHTYNIYETTSAQATAMAVSRRQNALADS